MLVEIQCDKFISYDKPRKPIVFHGGLNTVLGGQSADNSIGKSTFLLIVDYAFGGDTYKDSNAAHQLGNHTIKFAFEFNGKRSYFCRDIVNYTEVNICDENYSIKEPMPIKDFREFLFTSYNIDLPSVTFRDVVGRYLRAYGKDNYSEKRPLDSYSGESGEKAITALEKLFDVYCRLEEYKTAEAKKKEKKDIFKNARKLELVPYTITTQKQFKDNQNKIEELKTELSKMTDQADKDLSTADLSHADEALEIKGRITSIKRQRGRLLSQLNVLKINLNGGLIPSSADLIDLAQFFPNFNLQKIEDIEKFHSSMQQILSGELIEESQRLQVLVDAANAEIFKLEEDQRKLGIPAKLSKSFLDKYSEFERRINAIESQNRAYVDMKNFNEDVKIAAENLKNAQVAELCYIESEINEQMVRYNGFIYNGQRKAPILALDNGKKYVFQTPDDTGTGTSYKSLIVFDLSLLKLTPLPAIAHDSLIFKNIGDAPIDKIMELYMQSKKQIFISLDKDGAYSTATRKILNDTAVLHLNEGGDELFGLSWNKKDPAQQGGK